MQDLKLNDGNIIPPIGFGTWRLAEGNETVEAVSQAIKTGYRLIDTAKLYANEKSVGQAARDCGVAREQLFITTKLWPDDFGYDNTMVAFDASLERLGLDYVDLYLIHSPRDDESARHDSWRALIEIKGLGTAKSIGVSNFNSQQLEKLIAAHGEAPAVNQIEFHPYMYQRQLDTLKFCQQNNILIEAYSPLARAQDLDSPVITKIAGQHGKLPAQVLLRWAIQHGTVPIPKSANEGRIKENFDVFDFELSADEMTNINGLSNDHSVISGRP
jgi:diketogulonate reductase-like aldo/keto reductase